MELPEPVNESPRGRDGGGGGAATGDDVLKVEPLCLCVEGGREGRGRG